MTAARLAMLTEDIIFQDKKIKSSQSSGEMIYQSDYMFKRVHLSAEKA